MTQANKKFQQLGRKVHSWKASDYQRDKQSEKSIKPTNITTKEVTCKYCDFKAHYKFLRCPHCGKEQKN